MAHAYSPSLLFLSYHGGDCGQRTCPYGRAFVTSPQGDLNMDGDRYDNSHKLLVKSVGGGSNSGTMMETDDVLTLAVAIQTGELTPGDAILVGGETFTVDSKLSDTTFVLDHDRYTG